MKEGLVRSSVHEDQDTACPCDLYLSAFFLLTIENVVGAIATAAVAAVITVLPAPTPLFHANACE